MRRQDLSPRSGGRRLIVALLIAWVITSPYAALAGVSATGELTVTTRVTLETLAGSDEIPLLELVPDAGATNDSLLRLRWGRDFSGWFPVWQLELEYDARLFPGQAGADAGRRVLSDEMPQSGHTYDITLSYAPAGGALAIRIADVTAGKVIYAGGLSLAPYEGAVRVVAGAVAAPRYMPVATSWQPGSLEPSDVFLPRTGFDRSDRAAIRLHTPAPVPGEYRIYHVVEDRETLIAAVQPDIGAHVLPLDLTRAPLGTSALRLEYVVDGEVLLQEVQSITVGSVSFDLAPLQPNRGTATAETYLKVRSSDPLGDAISVSVRAIIYELVWDGEAKRYRELPYTDVTILEQTPVDLSTGDAVVLVTVPMPDRPGTWKVRLTPTVAPDLRIRVGVNERIFSNHVPANVGPGEPYTIVVLPDTQNMAQSHPTIFTRMTEWIAASAAERNIVAVLHVGDITNHDTPGQWSNAYESMSVLHGVVPYALTIGNHDMLGVRGKWDRRGQTRINEFFTAEEARRYNHLTGTLVPDRLENHYHLFTAGDDQYLVIALEFGPPNEAVAWAYEIAQQYPDHKLILLTHSYLDPSGNLSDNPLTFELAANPETTVNTAFELWGKLLRKVPNSFMVVSGHLSTEPVVPYRISMADDGHLVFQLLFNWQQQPNGGNGWLGLLTFHPDGTLEVNVYSPYLERYSDTVDERHFVSHMLIDLKRGGIRRLTP